MSIHIETLEQKVKTENNPFLKEARNTIPQTKEDWIKYYSNQIFGLWLGWRTPLGISRKYLKQVKQELSEFYKEPLKREFIEATYH